MNLNQGTGGGLPLIKRIVVILLSWWVVYTGGISHALDVRVAGPYYSEYDCDQIAQRFNARGRDPYGNPLPLYGHYFCEWLRE